MAKLKIVYRYEPLTDSERTKCRSGAIRRPRIDPSLPEKRSRKGNFDRR
jgi:hypothetical protein